MGSPENYVEPMNYFFDDPSLYDDYIPPVKRKAKAKLRTESGGGSGSGNTITGTNNADTADKSTSSDAWRFDGFSGNDIFKGGSWK